MPDPFLFVDDQVESPSRKAFAVTPSDATDFQTTGVVPKALYIGTPGDLVVQLVGDAGTVTFVNVGGGSILPIRPRRVLAATTATNIVGLC